MKKLETYTIKGLFLETNDMKNMFLVFYQVYVYDTDVRNY